MSEYWWNWWSPRSKWKTIRCTCALKSFLASCDREPELFALVLTWTCAAHCSFLGNGTIIFHPFRTCLSSPFPTPFSTLSAKSCYFPAGRASNTRRACGWPQASQSGVCWNIIFRQICPGPLRLWTLYLSCPILSSFHHIGLHATGRPAGRTKILVGGQEQSQWKDGQRPQNDSVLDYKTCHNFEEFNNAYSNDYTWQKAHIHGVAPEFHAKLNGSFQPSGSSVSCKMFQFQFWSQSSRRNW